MLNGFNFVAILPELVIVVTALIVLLGEIAARAGAPAAFPRRRHNMIAGLLTLAGLAVAGLLTVVTVGQPATEFQGMVRADDLSRMLNLIILLAAFLGVLLAWDYLTRFTTLHSEYYALLLIAVAGMMFLGGSIELITLFVSLEILSVSLYILTGFHRRRASSSEAAMKYFLLGAFASGFVLYGAALLYADTGTTFLSQIAANGTGGFFVLAGLALLLVGFGFKVAAVPFHMWTPDAYQGAPTPVTAFMSVATKAAAFVALARILQALPSVPYDVWSNALAILAVLTMTVGNLAALRQHSLKRMLAYSSIAQAGYMMVGLVAGTPAGLDALIYYLFVYTFMNLGAFAVAAQLEGRGADDPQDADISAANGLFARSPMLAVAMSIFLLSLAGIPPLAGFFGKLYLFSAAVESGWIWLAVVGMINSVISAYYYLRVTVAMFMVEPEEGKAEPGAGPARSASNGPARSRLPDSSALALFIAVVGTLFFGLVYSPVGQQLAQIASSK